VLTLITTSVAQITPQIIARYASFLLERCDVLLTENKDHFERLPNLKDKVMTPKEFCREFDQC